jgi:catechol 2,3-dioxygenase-like lactoylglutathione lyase family enzyme
MAGKTQQQEPREKVEGTKKDVPKLSRLVLHVGNLKKATRFYSDLLGTEGRAVGGGRVYFDCGPVILALLDPAQGGMVPRPIPDTIYFTVQDIEKIFERAQELECLNSDEVHGEPAGKIIERPWGERSFYAEDEWGNGLCFAEEKTFFKGDRVIR